MDSRSAALAVDEVEGWAITTATEATNAGDTARAEVFTDLAEAASDLGHMIRTLHRHLPADG